MKQSRLDKILSYIAWAIIVIWILVIFIVPTEANENTNVSGDNTIILDSDPTNAAGEAGSYFRLTAIDGQYWMVEGMLMAPTTSTGADVFQHV